MENSYDSAAKWSDSTSPYHMVSWSLLQSDSSGSDLSRFNLGFSSAASASFPADEFVGGIEKAESLSRSHRLAEKRRRDRINSHLSALRKLVPNSDKLDKAALLARVIEQVKELKQKAKESPIFQDLPTEADEVTVQPETISNDFEPDTIVFKASFCCEDQPEAISEIVRALTKFQLETIQAEVICVGGRMRINFLLKDSNCRETTSMANTSAKALKQSLCAALNRITPSSSSSSSSSSSVCRIRSKRQRWFLSSHYSQ